MELEFDGEEDFDAGVATLGDDSGWEELGDDGADASESPMEGETGLAGSGLGLGVVLGDGDDDELEWGTREVGVALLSCPTSASLEDDDIDRLISDYKTPKGPCSPKLANLKVSDKQERATWVRSLGGGGSRDRRLCLLSSFPFPESVNFPVSCFSVLIIVGVGCEVKRGYAPR